MKSFTAIRASYNDIGNPLYVYPVLATFAALTAPGACLIDEDGDTRGFNAGSIILCVDANGTVTDQIVCIEDYNTSGFLPRYAVLQGANKLTKDDYDADALAAWVENNVDSSLPAVTGIGDDDIGVDDVVYPVTATPEALRKASVLMTVDDDGDVSTFYDGFVVTRDGTVFSVTDDGIEEIAPDDAPIYDQDAFAAFFDAPQAEEAA